MCDDAASARHNLCGVCWAAVLSASRKHHWTSSVEFFAWVYIDSRRTNGANYQRRGRSSHVHRGSSVRRGIRSVPQRRRWPSGNSAVSSGASLPGNTRSCGSWWYCSDQGALPRGAQVPMLHPPVDARRSGCRVESKGSTRSRPECRQGARDLRSHRSPTVPSLFGERKRDSSSQIFVTLFSSVKEHPHKSPHTARNQLPVWGIEGLEVFDNFGSSGRTRTYNPSVNSRRVNDKLVGVVVGQ